MAEGASRMLEETQNEDAAEFGVMLLLRAAASHAGAIPSRARGKHGRERACR